MKYDFDTVVNRRGTNALKWDVGENELPMWVADMDFETAPAIRSAIEERAKHGAFGYTIVPEEWYNAYLSWWQNRHNFTMQKEWLMFCTGVVPAISSIVRKLTTVGENVLIQTPVYNIFYNSILNNGRNVLECPLQYDGVSYQIDFTDLEQKLSNPQTTLMILCNPHNPVGKIWEAETLARIGELCEKYHVVMVSDEIHCDLTDPDCDYIPFASVSASCRRNSITCIAPTKAFNLAGLQTSAISVPNRVLRHKVNRAINTDEVAEPNAFAIDAAIAAFTKGAEWLDALRRYLQKSKAIVSDYLQKNLPSLTLIPSHATYLLWIDCSQITDDATEFAVFLREKTGLYLSAGKQYGGNGTKFLRMNIACSQTVLADGLNRLKQGFDAYSEWDASQYC